MVGQSLQGAEIEVDRGNLISMKKGFLRHRRAEKGDFLPKHLEIFPYKVETVKESSLHIVFQHNQFNLKKNLCAN